MLEVIRTRTSQLLRSAVLIAAMGLVLALVGWLLGGLSGVALAFGAAIALAWITPGPSVERLLHASGAHALHPSEAPGLRAAVRGLAERAGLPEVPALFLVPIPLPQAMATESGGRSALAISPALLRLPPEEVVAVLAHEIAHLRHHDLPMMRLAQIVRHLTRSASTFGLLLLVVNLPLMLLGGAHVPWIAVGLLVGAPWLVRLLSLALSRSRELDADAGAVQLTGDPAALARALTRIEAASRGPWWTELFRVDAPAHLRTHPDTRERVARLRAMARGAAWLPDRNDSGHRHVTRPGRPRVIEPIWIRGPRHPAR